MYANLNYAHLKYSYINYANIISYNSMLKYNIQNIMYI